MDAYALVQLNSKMLLMLDTLMPIIVSYLLHAFKYGHTSTSAIAGPQRHTNSQLIMRMVQVYVRMYFNEGLLSINHPNRRAPVLPMFEIE